MSEDRLHRSVASYLRLALRPPTIWSTIPAGGGGVVRGAKLKAQGYQRGWPDILIIDRGPNVIAIELKTAKGKLSADQKLIARAFGEVQAFWATCRSIDEVDAALRSCNVPVFAQRMT